MLYTIALFGVAAVLVGAINLVLTQLFLSEPTQIRSVLQDELLGISLLFDMAVFERALVDSQTLVAQQTLDNVRLISLIALVTLFPISLLIGWFVAGRVLRPIDRITAVAGEISSTDLARRIHLDGPEDELHRLADTFDGMLDRLEQGAKTQRAFVEDASHELRNPLAVITTTLDVALASADPESIRQAAEVARRTADRMARTVDDLVAFARHQAQPLRRETLDLRRLVVEVADEYRATARARDVDVVASAPAGLSVLGDREALGRALGNLVSNAIRVAPAGSRIHCAAGRLDGWLWIGVRDEGPGIDPEQLPLVFQRAWRDGRPIVPGEGKGIGLAIVRQTAEAHGGTVSVTSAPGLGASFLVWLPEQPAHAIRPSPIADVGRGPDPLWAATTHLG
jgi:signal transduction histidine kinase